MSRLIGDYGHEPDLTHLDFPRRRPSISGTASCAGCADPQCGYCDPDYGWDGTYPEDGEDE